jgi:hypothetical protein
MRPPDDLRQVSDKRVVCKVAVGIDHGRNGTTRD